MPADLHRAALNRKGGKCDALQLEAAWGGASHSEASNAPAYKFIREPSNTSTYQISDLPLFFVFDSQTQHWHRLSSVI